MTRIDGDEPDRLRRADCAAQLQLSRAEAWLRQRSGRFPLPVATDDRGPYWHEVEIYRWAATSKEQRLVWVAPLPYWPTAERPALYQGAQQLPDCVVQLWKTPLGMIGVIWPMLRLWWQGSAHDILDELSDIDTLVRVAGDFGVDGPGLFAVQRFDTGAWNEFAIAWQDLSRVLGQPAPYWPFMLRIVRLITNWRPGAATVTYPTIPEVDTTPLLRLAATMDPDTPAWQALLHLVTIAQHRSTISAEVDLRILEECLDRVSDLDPEASPEQSTVVAAVALAVPDPVHEGELDLAVIRAGWLDILDRTDQLAGDCVLEASRWNGGKWFPHASTEEVDPVSEYGAEWAARLEPVLERKAVYNQLGNGDEDPLLDPECDAPVVQRKNGKLLVAVPQRLPTTEPLSEVILDSPVWIRTNDGILYPAPRNEYWGLSWGYSGSGPGSLALLIHRLLDDITAPGADNNGGAPNGLEELTALDWPSGTVLTRELLLAARDDRPYNRP